MKNWTLMGLAAALIGFGVMGCTPQAREEYSKAGEESSQAAKDTTKAAATDAKVSGQVVANEAEKAKDKIDDATLTGQIRTNISDSRDLKVDDLNIDTSNNTVTIKGTPHSEADHQKVLDIAKGTAPKDYKIVDNMTVAAGKEAGTTNKK